MVQTAAALVECQEFNPFSFGAGGDGRANRWVIVHKWSDKWPDFMDRSLSASSLAA
jgi:hypothetical protein